MAELFDKIFAEWWSINPYLTVIIIGSVVVFVIRLIIEFFSSFGSSDSSTRVTYEEPEEPSQEEIEAEKEAEEERREAEFALYALYKQREIEKWRSTASCGHCVNSVREYDEVADVEYYRCPYHGCLPRYEADCPHYCKEYTTLDGPV